MSAWFKIATMCAVLSALVSCSGQKFLATQSKGPITELLDMDTAYAHIIRPDDKISLSIWNHDDLSIGSIYSIYNSNESYGKWLLIDKDGKAELPKLGAVKISGLTAEQASNKLMALYGKHISNPVIIVKVLNKKVSVYGEVKSPGNYLLEKEYTSISELIGMAEGFSDYAHLKKVRLVRDNVSYNINLKRMDDYLLHNLPVHAGDIIIIPAKKGKTLDQKAPTLIPFSSALTALVLVVSILI
jgi:polysaccharide export outer membrane protein